jgi:hypothetical protein
MTESAQPNQPLDPLHAGIVQIARKAGINAKADPEVPTVDDSDWQVLVMASALIEAAVDGLLLSAISPARAAEAMTRSRFSDKLRLAVAMALVSEQLGKAAREVFELRNSVAHGLSIFSFQFQSHFSMSPRVRESFNAAVAPCLSAIGMSTSGLTDPRHSVFAVAYLVLRASRPEPGKA